MSDIILAVLIVLTFGWCLTGTIVGFALDAKSNRASAFRLRKDPLYVVWLAALATVLIALVIWPWVLGRWVSRRI